MRKIAWPAIRTVDSGALLVIDRIIGSQQALLPVEEPYAADMTANRLQEFRAGRSVARRAIQLVDGPAVGLPAGMAGEPLWPDGFSGSISHAGGYAAALAARQSQFVSVGLDLNDGRPLGNAAAVDLMSDEEIALVCRARWTSDLEAARNIVFSAKEALFKCQYPLLRMDDLEFDAVTLVQGECPPFLGLRGVNLPSGADAQIARVKIIPIVVHGVTLVAALLPPAPT